MIDTYKLQESEAEKVIMLVMELNNRRWYVLGESVNSMVSIGKKMWM